MLRLLLIFCALVAAFPAEVYRWVPYASDSRMRRLLQISPARDGSLSVLGQEGVYRFDGRRASGPIATNPAYGLVSYRFLQLADGSYLFSSEGGMHRRTTLGTQLIAPGVFYHLQAWGNWILATSQPQGAEHHLVSLRPKAAGAWEFVSHPEILAYDNITIASPDIAWTASGKHLVRLSRIGNQLVQEKILWPLQSPEDLRLNRVFVSEDQAWGHSATHVYGWDRRTNRVQVFPHDSNRFMYPDMASPRPGEVCYVDGSSVVCRTLVSESRYPLPSDRSELIEAIYSDAQGVIWLGLKEFGLLALHRTPGVSLFSVAQGMISLPYHFHTLADGRTLAATPKGIFEFNSRSGLWRRWDQTPHPFGALHIAPYSDRELMVVGGVGAQLFSANGRALRSFVWPSKPSLSYSNIAHDGNGEILLGADALLRVDRTSGSLAPIDMPIATQIRDVDLIPDGRVLLSTRSGLILGRPGRWQTISTQDGLVSAPLQAAVKDPRGEIYWVAYDDNPGFARIDLSDPGHARVRNFTDPREFSDIRCFELFFDSQGRLWRGGEQGLYFTTVSDPAPSDWHAVTAANGLFNPDIAMNSGYEDSRNHLWFGSAGGVIRIDPSFRPALSPSAVPVFLSRLMIDGKVYSPAPLLQAPRPGAVWRIEVGHLHPGLEANLRFEYRILPSQPNWVTTATSTFDLPPLLPGENTLEVRAHPTAHIQPGNTERITLIEPRHPLSAAASASIGLGIVLLSFLLYWFRHQVIALLPIPPLRRWQERHFFLQLRALKPSERSDALGRLPRTVRTSLKDLLRDFDHIESSEDERTRSGHILDSRYLLEHVIAKGGFATVYLGREIATGTTQAVKLFHQTAPEGSWHASRLAAELEAMRRLDHPGVVRLLHHGLNAESKPYLVMDYVSGINLRQALRNGSLQPQRALARIREAAEAISAVHAQGILHRDLKPENILLRHPNTPEEATVLIDFGVASVYDAIRDGAHSTYFAGSLDYAAPEQIAGLRLEASDVYSLAVVAFELLTGRRFKHTFSGGATPEAIERELALIPNAKAWARLLAQSASIEHSQRTRSAAAFLDLLSNI